MKKNKTAAQQQTSKFRKRHDIAADCNKKYEVLLRVHGVGGIKGIGLGTSRTWPKSILAWMQALQDLDALLKRRTFKGGYQLPLNH